jgi:hypothetical protein
MALEDPVGATYGRLVVTALAEPRRVFWPDGRARSVNRRVVCRCECGRVVTVGLSDIRNGNTASCGCLARERIAQSTRRHGHSPMGHSTGTYNSWASAKQRCTNPKHPAYKRYGGRGITMCDRWLESFDNFLADMGARPDGLTLDRRDNEGSYSPDNCRWATDGEQSRNTRRNVNGVINGTVQCAVDLARTLGVRRETVARRLKAQRPVDKALPRGRHALSRR